MFLLHNTLSTDPLTILKSGKLLSSAKTKNVQLFGYKKGSPYIFLRLQRKLDGGTFYLDYKLLLETKFYLHLGWKGEPEGKIIDGTKLSLTELTALLEEFGKKVDEYYTKAKKRMVMPRMMSNEILVANDIDLHKYLKKIYPNYLITKDMKKEIKSMYPNVELIK